MEKAQDFIMQFGKKIPFILLFFFSLSNCSEYFGRKPDQVDYELIELILQYSTTSGGSDCGRFSLPPIRGGPDAVNVPTNGTRTGFGVARCQSDSQIQSMGFTPNNIEYTSNGIRGSAPNARLGSQIDFVTLGGRKDQVIEVTFQLDRADAYLDVIGNATVGSNASASGPGFRITTERIQVFGTSGNFSTPPVGATPASPVGSRKTYCLEIHEEGVGGHLFGWSKGCGELTQNDRLNYEFDHVAVQTQNPGNRVGFVLNGVTMYQFTVGERIGLAGSLR
ncbi:MAG: hypothetical protein JJT78_08520 [Leptospira sp.]|nr:hypothetical protein [Leptospira sp.]